MTTVKQIVRIGAATSLVAGFLFLAINHPTPRCIVSLDQCTTYYRTHFDNLFIVGHESETPVLSQRHVGRVVSGQSQGHPASHRLYRWLGHLEGKVTESLGELEHRLIASVFRRRSAPPRKIAKQQPPKIGPHESRYAVHEPSNPGCS